MLNGLYNFYAELKIDTTSFLHDYYKKNKYLLTDEEDDDELDNDDNKSGIVPIRASKTLNLDDTKSASNAPLTKQGSSIIPSNGNNQSSINPSPSAEGKPKGKRPVLPANCSDAMKSYYETVEKVIDLIVKSYELTEANGIRLNTMLFLRDILIV